MESKLPPRSPEEMGSAPSKLMRIRLSGLVRMEYVELVEVPADTSEDELDELVNRRYSDVDGGQFTLDTDYWERGECTAEPAEASATVQATHRVRRDERGFVVAELAETLSGPAFLVAEHYAHCFVGSQEVITRWVLDRRTREMLCGEAMHRGQWRDVLDRVQLDDVLEDVETNEVEVSPADFGVDATEVLPAWATNAMLHAARAQGFNDEDERRAVLDFLAARAQSEADPQERPPRLRG